MKNIFLRIFIFSIALYFGSCATSEKTTNEADALKGTPKALTSQFKLLTINAQHGLKDKADVKKFADWVKTTGAEVVAVQQIIRATDSKPEFDAYTELSKRLDMRGTFAKARYFQGWDSGNALFCMYPILQSNTYTLPTGKGKTRRSLSFGVFEMGLKSLAFASTDLDDDDLSERVKQVYEILSIQKTMPEYPMIVAGNFGESSKGKGPVKMLERFACANGTVDQTVAMPQHVYVPIDGKMNVISAEKILNKTLNTNALLVTIEVIQ